MLPVAAWTKFEITCPPPSNVPRNVEGYSGSPVLNRPPSQSMSAVSVIVSPAKFSTCTASMNSRSSSRLSIVYSAARAVVAAANVAIASSVFLMALFLDINACP